MLEIENANKQGKGLQGERPMRQRLVCCVTNKTTFVGQDTQLQSPHVKHKWRARHTRRSARTPRTRNAAAHEAEPTLCQPRCPRTRSSLYCCSVPLFWFSALVRLVFLFFFFLFWFAGPGLGDESRCVLDNTTMGTTAAARERPACNSQGGFRT